MDWGTAQRPQALHSFPGGGEHTRGWGPRPTTLGWDQRERAPALTLRCGCDIRSSLHSCLRIPFLSFIEHLLCTFTKQDTSSCLSLFRLQDDGAGVGPSVFSGEIWGSERPGQGADPDGLLEPWPGLRVLDASMARPPSWVIERNSNNDSTNDSCAEVVGTCCVPGR
jgi:hypothetical protein